MVVVNVGPLWVPMVMRPIVGRMATLLRSCGKMCKVPGAATSWNGFIATRGRARAICMKLAVLLRWRTSLCARGTPFPEMLMRTVAGLYMSDLHEDVSLLEELEWCPPQALVPRDVVRSVLKDVKRKQQLQPASRGAGKELNASSTRTGGFPFADGHVATTMCLPVHSRSAAPPVFR